MDTTNVEHPVAAGQMTTRESQWCNAVRLLSENTLRTGVGFKTALEELYHSLRLLRANYYDVELPWTNALMATDAAPAGVLPNPNLQPATSPLMQRLSLGPDGVMPNPSPQPRSDGEREPLTQLEREFFRDVLGLIDFATRNGLDFRNVAGALNHDVGAIFANYGASVQNAVADFFTPRVSGWAKRNIAPIGQPEVETE